MGTNNYSVTKAGRLIATGGKVTVSSDKNLAWVTGNDDNVPDLQMRIPINPNTAASFGLDAGERLFLFKIGDGTAIVAAAGDGDSANLAPGAI